jgi:hypothetical protein
MLVLVLHLSLGLSSKSSHIPLPLHFQRFLVSCNEERQTHISPSRQRDFRRSSGIACRKAILC